ncbi:MAG TPA: phage integrase N-terminal SAM-like domain-containing protein [Verrucomicrobiota bacterium]|nr:phage integrase N-terminal SAM-like domain-containing protein [Verrucomicrobiota bacterium]HNT13988.1 phage integrase N-terminal SAM-like domain-containing protein [Verrucomicrobiota bacterium]
MISEKAPRFLSPNSEQRRQRPLGRRKPHPKSPLREQVREVMRCFHYSQRTEDTYWQWIVRYLRFHKRPAAPPPASGLRPSASIGHRVSRGSAGAGTI